MLFKIIAVNSRVTDESIDHVDLGRIMLFLEHSSDVMVHVKLSQCKKVCNMLFKVRNLH